ncbi:DUF3502 domain-containing protein [Anaerosporobacter sp.]|uniref:DUF3502 domain-containing protein n=1 Tax=Anaerosporobacter sp. TaxID=1872529 RepID=UPI00286F2725|nr:extracellular solute-binding protein [Anaerosporobacter sp.]
MKRSKSWGIIILIFICCFMNGCKQNGGNEETNSVDYENVIKLKAITIGKEPKEGMDELYKQLDALTIPELNCTLRFEFIPWGDEKKQINIAVNSGEYDFIPGGVFSDYQSLTVRNAFIDLNQYLDIVPDLVNHYLQKGENALKNYEINGGLYGIPQLGFSGLYTDITEGFFYREDLRKEWGLEPVTDLETMEAYLYRAKQDERYADEALITDNRIWTGLWSMIAGDNYIEISTILENPFFVVSVENPYVPVSRMETPEFKEVLRYIKKWYDDGIIDPNLLVYSDNEGSLGLELMKKDRKPCETNAPIWSCNKNFIPKLYETNPDWEFGFFSYMIDKEAVYATTGEGGSVISIPSKSEHPDTAIRLLEKVHTDSRYYNLLVYGVEGIHYNTKDNALNYDGIKETNRYPGWTAASDDYMQFSLEAPNKVWTEQVYDPMIEKGDRLAKEVPYCPIDRFSFDLSSVDSILNKMNEVKEKYFQPLLCGNTDNIDVDLNDAISKLNDAGINIYMERIEQALQEYKNTLK